jgi:hypothetical protein
VPPPRPRYLHRGQPALNGKVKIVPRLNHPIIELPPNLVLRVVAQEYVVFEIVSHVSSLAKALLFESETARSILPPDLPRQSVHNLFNKSQVRLRHETINLFFADPFLRRGVVCQPV